MIEESKAVYYIIADHLRTAIFALGDKATFAGKGRGYILRKLIKKVALLAKLKDLKKEQLIEVSEELITINKVFYPNIAEKKREIIGQLEKEIERSLSFINNCWKKLENSFHSSITAEEIFYLYDTLGIPNELIKIYFEKSKQIFPEKEFESLLLIQKEKSLLERKRKKIQVFSK